MVHFPAGAKTSGTSLQLSARATRASTGLALVPGLAIVAMAAVLTVAPDVSVAQEVDPLRFNHQKHAERTPECTTCHILGPKTKWVERRLVGGGRADHKPCSNAGCHAKSFGRANDKKFCGTCHRGSLRKVLYPPYRVRGNSDFSLANFSHKEHIRADNCGQCHTPGKRRRATIINDKQGKRELLRAGHVSCGNKICHGEAVKPHMSDCTNCHVPRKDGQAIGKLTSAKPSLYRVNSAFTHKAHDKVAGSDGCRSCHTNVEVSKGAVVPFPTMQTCESCHNGKKAFRALGFACKKCHVQPKGARR